MGVMDGWIVSFPAFFVDGECLVLGRGVAALSVVGRMMRFSFVILLILTMSH